MNIEEMATTLGGSKAKLQPDGSWVTCCPAHEDNSPSLHLTASNETILWKCHTGCSQDAVLAALQEKGLLGKGQPKEKNIPKFIWSVTTKSPKVGEYFKTRGITGAIPETLRFNRYNGKDMIVAPVTSPGETQVNAIHRTYLNADGTTGDRKMMGPCRGGAIWLDGYDHETIIIGEGIETVLSARQAMGLPAVAAMTAGFLKDIKIPDNVKQVYILADSDPKYAGQDAARALEKRLNGKSKVIAPCDSCFTQSPEKKDFNDLSAEEIKERFKKPVDISKIIIPPKGFITLSEVSHLTYQPNYLVYGQIEENTQSLLYGDSETKKTFILISLMMSIATGLPWCGQDVKQGGVVFLFGEGMGGIVRRCRAWARFNGIADEDTNNLLILDRTLFVDLEQGEKAGQEIIDLIHSAAEYRGITSIKMIAWDTASSLFGIDENSAKEVAACLQLVRHISNQCGNASDQICHHMGHSAKDRPRGSYAWMANVDAHHRVEAVDRLTSKINAFGKMKDADPIAFDRVFDLKYQELGFDDKLNTYGSLVAKHKENVSPDKGKEDVGPTDEMILKVKGNMMAIDRGVLLDGWKEMKFQTREAARTTLVRMIKTGRLKDTGDGGIYYPST